MDKDELVSQFVSIVSCNPEQATFYLEANKWDLDSAMSQYCEDPPAAYGDSNPASDLGSDATEVSSPTTKAKSGGKSVSFATIRDLSDAEEDDDDDEEHENYFAGGERSGISVQGPTKKESKNLVDDILKKAAEAGPAPIDEDEGPSRPPSYFSGAGYKLGSDDEPSTLVSPLTALTAGGEADDEEETRSVTRQLTFWRNGFSVEDGPLLRYDDPSNEDFLKAINSGRAPLSLLNVQQGQPVDVRVSRRLDEDYVLPPRAAPRPFEGAGHRLGSPVPRVVSAADRTPGSYPESSTTGSSPRTTQLAQPRQYVLNMEAPLTSLQIRMGDGTRLVAKFNHTHTVGDVRAFINASRPGESARQYILLTMFPTKELTDETQTVKDAGLLNAVVVQRYL